MKGIFLKEKIKCKENNIYFPFQLFSLFKCLFIDIPNIANFIDSKGFYPYYFYIKFYKKYKYKVEVFN